MKKLLLLIIASLVVFTGVGFAAVIPSSSTFTASINLSGTGVQTWTAALKKISDNTSAASIGWTSVSAGQSGYKLADQYLEVSINITNIINWRMLVYTNNTDFTGNKSTAAARGFGLVGQTNKAYGLPLAYTVKDSTQAISNPSFSITRGGSYPEGFTDYMWKFVNDKNRVNVDLSSAWDATNAYNRVWDNNGFYWHENPAQSGNPGASNDNKVVIYFAADFTTSLAQTYSTNSLTLDVLQL